LLYSFIILLLSCNTTDPPINVDGKINLNLIDVSVTETYLFISLENNTTRSISVFQDNEIILNFNLAENDTIILINNLKESSEYKVKAVLKNGAATVDVSSEIRLTTRAPTNQNITWQVYTYGNPSYGSSVLRDVSIIDENNIWVVGEVYQLDSLGQTDTQVYGAGHWNGSEWNLMKVPLRDYGNPRPAPTPFNLKTVFTTENEIYASTSAHIIKFENDKWVEKYFLMEDLNFNGQVIQMYAYSEDNIYCVGRNGSIYNITSTGWNKLESGTETTLGDIWGCVNPISGDNIKYVTGRLLEVGDEAKLIKISGSDMAEEMFWGEYSDPYSIWSNKSFPIFVSGSYFYANKTGNWERVDELSGKSSTCVRGAALNDIFICGSQGLLAQYNGLGWKRYDEVVPGSIDIKGNTVCIVGEIGLDAIIVIGKRN
ncbi:MAG: hypothetical protein V3W20_15150, partial [Candidatus Neomarinimicrobiota bacterium]